MFLKWDQRYKLCFGMDIKLQAIILSTLSKLHVACPTVIINKEKCNK